MTRMLIENGIILTGNEAQPILRDHALAIDGALIEGIIPRAQASALSFDERIDARGRVVMPGMINAHMHCYSALALGLSKAAPAADFNEVLRNLWWRLDKQLTLEDVALSAQLASMAAIRAGTTTFIDHHASPGAIGGSLKEIARVVGAAGLRACLCYEVSDRDGPARAAEGIEENCAFLHDLNGDDRITGLFGLHASFTLEPTTLRRAAAAAKEAGVGCHIHVGEAASDQHFFPDSPVARLHEVGLLGPQSLCAHCVWVNEADIRLLAETGTMVTHQPQSNMNNAVGVMPLQKLLDGGVLVGLGTDAMTQNMLEELRVGLWLHKLTHGQPSGFFPEMLRLFANNVLIANRLFPVKLGVLEPGAAADVVLLDYEPPTPLDEHNLGGHLIFGMSQAKVDTTIAGGKVLYRDGHFTTLDERAVNQQARALARRLWDRF